MATNPAPMPHIGRLHINRKLNHPEDGAILFVLPDHRVARIRVFSSENGDHDKIRVRVSQDTAPEQGYTTYDRYPEWHWGEDNRSVLILNFGDTLSATLRFLHSPAKSRVNVICEVPKSIYVVRGELASQSLQTPKHHDVQEAYLLPSSAPEQTLQDAQAPVEPDTPDAPDAPASSEMPERQP